MPPFPGFFLKLKIICVIWSQSEPLLMACFILSRGAFMYVYVSFLLWLVASRCAPKGASPKNKIQFFRLLVSAPLIRVAA